MILALAAIAVGGATQAAPSYPAALDREAVSAWLRESTDLPPEQVVAVSPSAATAIVQRAPATNGRVEARLRAVALTPQAAARSGVLAWEMRLEVNCRTGEVRTGATVGYATRRASGEGVALAPADAGWRKPRPNTTLEASWRAICDADFQSPLAAGQLRIAKAAPGEPAGLPVAPPVAVASAPPASRAAIDPAPESAKPARLAAGGPAPARPRPTVPAAVAHGHAAVQVVSSPVEAETRKTLASLQHRFGDLLQGIEPRVVPAKVHGQTVYRGVLAGFATSGARAFCRTLKQGGHDCLML